MYKIYINDTPLLLLNTQEYRKLLPLPKNWLGGKYTGKPKNLLTYIDLLEKTGKFDSVVVYFDDLQKLIDDFESLYKIIEAAGGIVFNDQNEILVIYRLDHWDLPKGKIDPGESRESAALREVKEETGIENLELTVPITLTRHTYKNDNGNRILKLTHWFSMKTRDKHLVPQTEENIEIAEWIGLKRFFSENRKAYKSILDVLAFFQ